MSDNPDRAPRRATILLAAIIAATGLAALVYLGMPASHRQSAIYRQLVDLVSRVQSTPAAAAPVSTDRHMDPHFESDLRSFIPSSSMITIAAVAGDKEAQAFAQEIAAWLRANGWQHVLGVNERETKDHEPLVGTNLEVNPKGGMELIVGARPQGGP